MSEWTKLSSCENVIDAAEQVPGNEVQETRASEVSRPLASVKRICKAGHLVVFDEDGSFIFNKMTGEINQLREESGNYMFDVWIPPKSTTTSFHRQ